MIDLGTVRPGSTIRIPFSSFDKDDGSSITMTNYAVADILVYKDGSTTERASTSGYTATTDFDAKTGKHLAVIDLADNTTAGFYSVGSEYLVAIDAVTVDAVTTGGWIARFRLGYVGALLDTTIATLASQTSFTLTAGPAEDNALNGMEVVIHDVASAVQCGRAVVSAYTGSTRTVTLAAGTTFTAATTDGVSVMGPAPLQPTTMGRTLDVSSGGEAGVDWANVGTPGSTVSLSATTVNLVTTTTTLTNAPSDSSGVTTLLSRIGGAITITSGRVNADLTHIAAAAVSTTTAQLGVNVVQISGDSTSADNLESYTDGTTPMPVNAIQISGDATAADNAEAFFDGTGYAGTNNVIPTVTTATNVTTVNGLAANVITAAATAPDFGTEVATAVWASGTRTLTSLSGLTVDTVTTLTNLPAITANWLTAAGTAADFTTEIQAGLATASALSTLDDFVDTEVATIKAVTDKLDTMLRENETTAGTAGDYQFHREAVEAVWDVILSAHLGSGTTGNALNAAGAAGDPWTTTLPGAYGAGSAGFIVGTNVNTTISSRASQTTLDTLDDFVDTEVAAIKAKTDLIPAGGFPTNFSALAITAGGVASSDIVAISGDTNAANNFETMLDGTGGNVLYLGGLVLINNDEGGIVVIDNTHASAPAISVTATSGIAVATGGADIVADVTGSLSGSVGSVATDGITSGSLATSAITEIQSGLSTLTQVNVRSAVGLASANLDTQLGAIDDFLDTEVAAIKAKTDNLPSDPADASDIVALFAIVNTKLDTIDDFLDTEIVALTTAVGDVPTNAELATALDALPTAVENADALLGRTISGSANGGRTVTSALRSIRNKVAFDVPSAGSFTVYAEDDTTVAFTGTYTRSVTEVNALTSTDPA